jgi:hypothetical protein
VTDRNEIVFDPSAGLRSSQVGDRGAVTAVMEKVRSKYFATAVDVPVRERLEDIIDGLCLRANPSEGFTADNVVEADGILLVGESGSGKSRILNHVIRKDPLFSEFGKIDSYCPIVRLSLPSPCPLIRLGRGLLRRLGLPVAGSPDRHIIMERVRDRLVLKRTRILWLDEFHHVTQSSNIQDIKQLLNFIKSCLIPEEDTPPVAIIISGLPELVPIIEMDPQVRRRLRPIELPPIELPADEEFLTFVIGQLAEVARLSIHKNVCAGRHDRLAHAATYQRGIAIEIVQDAIERALKAKSRALTMDHFVSAHAVRTGSGPAANPFVVADWKSVRCDRILRKNDNPTGFDRMFSKEQEAATKRVARKIAKSASRRTGW